MATVSTPLDPRSFLPAATNGAGFKAAAGTSFPVPSLAFDAAAEESIYTSLPLLNYGSGNLTLRLSWYADTASSGDVVWGAQVACVTPDTDSQDIETKAFATAQTVTDTHLGTTGQRLHTCDLTITNLDSAAAGDYVALRIYRAAADGADTMTGDAMLAMAELRYSDT